MNKSRIKPVRWAYRFASSIIRRLSIYMVYTVCALYARFALRVTIEGLEQIPASGAVLLVARHYHHLFDGCVLIGRVPRRIRILVALDGARSRRSRSFLERLCSALGWPVLLRDDRLRGHGADYHGNTSVYTLNECKRYMRHAVTGAVRLLRNKEGLLIFPEAYPTIDATPASRREEDSFLPFRSGVARIVEMAERDGCTRVAIVPVGLRYAHRRRWQVTLRFGSPLRREDFSSTQALVQALEEWVQKLSFPAL